MSVYLGKNPVGVAINIENTTVMELDSIAIKTQPTNRYYTVGQTFNPAGMEVIANYSYDEDTIENILITNYTYTNSALIAGDNAITISYTLNGTTKTTSVTVTAFAVGASLNDTSWSVISQVAQAGCGDAFWDVGDCKAIILNGNIGSLAVSSLTLYVFILDFNHVDNGVANNNIIFGGFKSALTNGKELALIHSVYGSNKTDGTLCFNMSHWGSSSYGGWKGCDLRYDILGATETQPSGYGAAKTTSSTGYDATTAAITAPVANTLMAALPSEFRSVLRLRTHYVDNNGNSSNVDANVTAIIDAISLLSEFEVFGLKTYANQYEKNHQTQMAYYDNGNSSQKYRHSSQSSTAVWWEASPYYNIVTYFCSVSANGDASGVTASYSCGLAPTFKV